MSLATVQQQQASRARAPFINSAPELFWTVDELVALTRSPDAAEAIAANWRLIAQAMTARGIWDRENAAAVAATVAIETAHTFQPVKEAFWLSEEWRINNLIRYYPYYGRGFIQLTWKSNYQAAQDALGIPLVGWADDISSYGVPNPENAMDPETAARILAWFWDTHGIAPYARAQDWAEVRRRVQGADAGLSNLIVYANGLLAL